MSTDVETTPVKKASPWFSDGVYNLIKQFAQYWFPAAGALYAGLAGLWGFPYAVQVVGSIALIDIFLGALLGISTAVYNASGAGVDGALVVDASGDTETHSLEFSAPLTTLSQQKTITLAVTPKAVPSTVPTVVAPTDPTTPASQD